MVIFHSYVKLPEGILGLFRIITDSNGNEQAVVAGKNDVSQNFGQTQK